MFLFFCPFSMGGNVVKRVTWLVQGHAVAKRETETWTWMSKSQACDITHAILSDLGKREGWKHRSLLWSSQCSEGGKKSTQVHIYDVAIQRHCTSMEWKQRQESSAWGRTEHGGHAGSIFWIEWQKRGRCSWDQRSNWLCQWLPEEVSQAGYPMWRAKTGARIWCGRIMMISPK